jgi:uncharacterized glyoxalase superfamily protein PhnB
MTANRSAPHASLTPVLSYPDVRQAVRWLVDVFGLVERVRVGEHRSQLSFGDGAVVVADGCGERRPPGTGEGVTHSLMARVVDIDAHYARVLAAGASTFGAPVDMAYGERQYSALDLAGHRWTFTESVKDVAPEEWGGETVRPW